MSEKTYRSLKEISPIDYYTSGHRTCAGCGPALGYRMVTKAAGPTTVLLGPTGCMYVANAHQFLTSPYSIPWYHTQLGGGGAAGIGTAAAFRALMMKGKRRKEGVNVVVYGGDGGFADIGYSGLSMAMTYDYQRLVYVLYDNEAYANTGIQATSSTPWGASTTFTPTGKVNRIGNDRMKKNVALTMAAHPGVKYVATANFYPTLDLMNKMTKALNAGGPAFLQVLAPCPKGWFFDPKLTVDVSRLAVDTGAWVLWEYENGTFRMTYKPPKRRHLKDYMRTQGRFAHIKDEEIDELDKRIEDEWKYWLESDKQGKLILPWSPAMNALTLHKQR